ncbi:MULTISPECIES: flagellar motor stator protein MotA [Thioclava]|uniref:Flagellar motor stator protein MotA n=1 Tax=Thioclava nitratireducens TaxID=1915078 RepID=A0ABM6ICV6_9RHOB|nr:MULTISPECIES: flagellar motor stator protein MotA [Thioclava]AQS46567.1 flagellar motor stator protein MotA [Thioclava nitratireducens]OWY02288.1 flagellar motor stator protein MotA [Thioclava sp. IC9]OWY02614.1 flagellar motor stator protein MotA [Thioclava sp. F1Mire-8]OWY08276.1 flagellar motor stator protein MotA [Thioclava sp. F42-5]OWY13069.1 flagellar motor stator protein MotA [Thioclava sp. F34-6]
MIGVIGIVIIFVMVFGGYVAAGGKMGIILKSLPFEMIMIGGAAVGAFVLSNDLASIKHTLKDVGKVFKGPKWKPDDYRDLLCLLFELIRLARQNPVAIEEHIEDPEKSSIFGKYPKILHDHEAVDIICDTMRSASMNYDDPMQVEEVLDKQLEANYHHAMHSSHAMQSVADAMPALGIVAAVLGVIKTMGSIDQPPEILGKMIGGALVGTFLGVFIAYGFIAPFASRMKGVTDEDSHFYKLIREVLIANLHNHATNICIEVGRQNTPHHIRPSFSDLEEALKSVKSEAA